MATDQYTSSQVQRLPDDYADPMRHQEYLWRRWGALKTERASWDSHARELASLLLPRASRFTTSETNQGGPKHNKIYDNTGLRAARILGAGMMSGLTSPARPWMRFKIADDDLMEYEPVKVWCAETSRLVLSALGKSNAYRVLHQGYIEQGVFGTSASIVMPNKKTLIHSTALTWGEYAIATNAQGMVDTLYREFRMTAVMMAREFGLENCSTQVRNAYAAASLDTWFDVVHSIEPNLDFDERFMDQRAMPFRSCYFELGGEKGKYLRESGFRKFRGLCPRWQTTGQDVYGESPGMEALGDAKQLQHEQFRKAQGIDYQTKPPVSLPTSMKGTEVDMLPGGVTFFDQATGVAGQRQLFDVNLNLQHLLEDIQDVRGRINSAFYADLFLMIANMDRGGDQKTATEIAELHEEKLLMLGPVLEREHNENIEPLVDMTFDALWEQGMIPPPPPELEGMPLETELLGILAQAQKAVQTGTIDRFLGGVMAVAQIHPEVVDKVNGDELVEIYGDSLGVDPRVLVDDRQVAATRQARAQAQQQAKQEAAQTAQADQVAKAGTVATQGGASNLGADVIGMFSGYQSPQAERLGTA
ncbi:Head-to-tail connector protein, podovirus-type [uncultured Caudovirales phage]|uniref:Head-to-tail connector protein, podovirus-type n=1 Tax=uncultured Caudovirales phage TaxID=2100421 RepID=A0A6J5RWS4_9CAUD|nr:Head-to-tail connector protein, podovirus-type [uncultured Caudovirales phage]